jgi:hypothetical protein
MKSIIILIPLWGNSVPMEFFLSFLELHSEMTLKYNVDTVTSRNCLIDRNRENLVRHALKMGSDYILWLDADQTYPKNMADVLVKHIDSGKSMVGGVIPNKVDGAPSIYSFTGNGLDCERKKIDLANGAVQVDVNGMGGMMINPKVFESIPAPWFNRISCGSKEPDAGEDISFFKRCKDAGVDVWCDSSLHYGHIKNVVVLPEQGR